jgi:membrane protein YdbS with pleckstrin-like domain
VSLAELLVGVVLGLIVNEATDLSPWLGRVLVGWSAHLRYGDTAQARTRAEELKALINVRPGKLFKLCTGAGFAGAALAFRLRRLLWRSTSAADEPLSEKPLDLIRRPYEEDMPTTLVARYLFPTERYRGEWKRHWIILIKGWSVVGLYGVLGVWATCLRIKPRYQGEIIAAICVLCAVLVVHRLLSWYFDRFVITNKRLMMTRGLIYRRVEMIPLLRVTNLEYVQSPFGRLLSYGSFRTDSREARRSIRRLRDLPNPNELYLRIIEEVYEPQAVEARLMDDTDDEPATEVSAVIASLQALAVNVNALIAALHADALHADALHSAAVPPDGEPLHPAPLDDSR